MVINMEFENLYEEKNYIDDHLEWEYQKVLNDYIKKVKDESYSKGYEWGKQRGSEAMKSAMIVCCIAIPVILLIYAYVMAFSDNYIYQLIANLLGWPVLAIVWGLPQILYEHNCEKNGW